MYKFRTVLLPLAVICLIVFFSTTAELSAEDPGEKVDKPVAGVNIGANSIGWTPTVEYKTLELTVSGPDGTIFTKSFDSGSSVYLDPRDDRGNDLVDGPYTYELRVIPANTQKNRSPGDIPGTKEGGTTYGETLTQTGYFQIRGGKFVTPSSSNEGMSRTLDIVHADDVIIDGSLCVGNDCYNGYAFGFDTIALLENNLRIFFDDTSTIQNYPRNDWRIICNDSTDGGGNYFAIEDATDVSNIFVLEAGAPNNSLYVDSQGDVGINTSTPYYELHIVDGDSPCIRLDQDGSYGWTPQKWDLCGNESNFFIRDATHASKLPFRIQPDAPTDSIFIKSTGWVGLGTSSPVAALDVQTTGANAAIVCQRTSGALGKITARTDEVFMGSGTNHPVRFVANNNEVITIEPRGDVGIGGDNPVYKLQVWNDAGTAYGYSDGGAWNTGSSRKFKENIRALNVVEAMKAFRDLNPVSFTYKGVQNEEHLGFIAEDVPEIVATKNRDAVSAMDIVTLLTKVVQEQQKSIRRQEKKISDLQKEIDKLKKISR